MKRTDGTPVEPPLSDQLLAYLVEYKQAQDTLEGITWWLIDQRVKFYAARVKEALDELVSQGLVLERAGPDKQLHYRLNRRRLRQIRARLKHA